MTVLSQVLIEIVAVVIAVVVAVSLAEFIDYLQEKRKRSRKKRSDPTRGRHVAGAAALIATLGNGIALFGATVALVTGDKEPLVAVIVITGLMLVLAVAIFHFADPGDWI